MANIQITGLVEDTSPSATDVLVKEDSGGTSANKTPLQYVATAPQVHYMYKAATELTISSDAITVTQSSHKLQPETGTSDDLDTISGTVDGESGILFITDEGTDTITIKHGTGNIDIVGGSDLDLSNGAVFWYSDGTTIYVIGGGGAGGGDIVAELVNSEVSITGVATLTSTAFGIMHVCSGTSADYTVTLPAASGNGGKIIGFRMSNALTKLVTLDGNASEEIDGATTRPMWSGESAILLCDGTGWTKISGKTIPMMAAIKSPTTESIPNTTVTKITCSTVDHDNTGFVASSSNKLLNIKRSSLYRVAIAGKWTVPPVSNGEQTRFHKNGAFVFNVSLTSAPQFVVLTQSCTAGDYHELYQYQSSGGALNNYADGTMGMSIGIVELPGW